MDGLLFKNIPLGYFIRILIFVSINLLRLESLKEMLEWWMLLEIRVLNINMWTMNIIEYSFVYYSNIGIIALHTRQS